MIGQIDAGISSRINGVRCTSAVYFLWACDRIVYAGQSINVLKRICEHAADKEFDKSTFEPIPASDLTFVESYAIWFFRPRYNKHVPLLGSLGCNYSGKLKRRSVEFICSALRSVLILEEIANRFAEADEYISNTARNTSSLHYRKTLAGQIRRNNRVREMVLGYCMEATDGR